MSEPVRMRDDDYEKVAAAQEVLGLPFPETIHVCLNTDILNGSVTQNARRAIQYYHTYVLEQYDEIHDVPAEDMTFDGADQAIAGLTVGAEKHWDRWESEN